MTLGARLAALRQLANSASAVRCLRKPHPLALREQRVMLDADLALLYGVQNKMPVQAV